MKPPTVHPHNLLIVTAIFASIVSPLYAIPANEWRHRQTLEVSSEGLNRLELPPETLDAARSNLEDLRLLDPSGAEVPFLIERPAPRPGSTLAPKEFHYSASPENQTTTIEIETGVSDPITGISLETPARNFLKPIRVEGSVDGTLWQPIASGQLIFRQSGGADNQRVNFEKAAWKFIRVTVDDHRSEPVPFTGARLQTPGTDAPVKTWDVSIKSRDENPKVSRLSVDLGSANLPIASLKIETPEALFTRTVSFAIPEVADGSIRERALGQGVIYRIGIEGKNEAHLQIPLEQKVPSRELILFVHNEDSPPLAITSVSVETRLTRLVFFAQAPGQYLLLTGNSRCPAPRYDLASLAPQLEKAEGANPQPRLVLSRLAGNPDFKEPDSLAGLALTGAPLEVAEWKYRKPVQISGGGVHQLELDLDALAHSSVGGEDLRLVSEGKQIPFLIEHPSILRGLSVPTTVVVVPKNPGMSRWSIKLPQAGMPITRLTCSSPASLFERDLRLWEEITTNQGEKYQRELGIAKWRQTPGAPLRELALDLTNPPRTDTLFLETSNGDNAAIELRDFRCFHPVTRLIFKTASSQQPIWLYYGNPNAHFPHYDLSLVAAQELRVERLPASAGPQELAKPGEKGEEKNGEPAGILFWGALAVVVAALLVVVARLLPKIEPQKE